MSQSNDNSNVQTHENIHSQTISWIKKVVEENNQTDPTINFQMSVTSNDNEEINDNHVNATTHEEDIYTKSLTLEKPSSSWDSFSSHSSATLSAENDDDGEFKQQRRLEKKKNNNFDSEDFYKQKSYFNWDSDSDDDCSETSTVLDDDDAVKPELFDDAIYYADEILKDF
ncbi:4810_t:CDS:1, partial [Ambispora leptoticha]